ncbi:MAG TPA: hypothetical protein VH601_13870 [Bryobacteraceae bacterium]|jgi:hypothetical protein
MQNYSVLYRAAAVLCLWAAPSISLAVETHVWEQADQGDFERGTSRHLSIRSDGHISLAPEFKELDSTTVPYLWAVTQDSKGTLFYAGGAPTGATTKVFALAPDGKPRVFAELPGLEVHALAVDAQDRIYAAVLPDAKIYRIEKNGKPQLFFNPNCKYIWAMVFDRQGNLFVATGDSGVIYKVTPDGHGSKFFETNDTHARSMILASSGNLIVGTEPGGLIIRITPQGRGFVLYQTDKREVTAVAEHDGVTYAAAVGNKPAGVSVANPTPSVAPTPPASPGGTGGTIRVGTAPPSVPLIGAVNASITGGSALYRIQKDGFTEQIWKSSTDLAYAIALDVSGRPLLGTGNQGIIYRIDSDQLFTELLNAPPTQVTVLLQGRNGVIYAATGNVGNLYSIGPGLQMSGTLESETLDTNDFAYWGNAHVQSIRHGGEIALETRSGNLNNPENNWSGWTKVPVAEAGGAVASPPARFLQYRLTLGRSADDQSPEISAIEIGYLPKNVAPKVQQIDIAPFNYRQAPGTSQLERSVAQSGSPATLTLQAVGQKKPLPTVTLESAGTATLQYNKGFVTVRWSASDANDDALVYKVEIQREHDSFWRLLKDKLQDRFFAFDSTALPDGRYTVRVTASDAPGNTPAEALTGSLETDPFTIDNTPPEFTDLSIAAQGQQATIAFTAHDDLSWISKAEYSANGGEWVLVQPLGKVTDSQTLHYKLNLPAGQDVAIRVFDEDDNVIVKQVRATAGPKQPAGK